MNVTTRYQTAIGAPRCMGLTLRPDIVEIIERSKSLAGQLDDAHEQRHELNMQEWRRRWQVHIDAGEFDIAANIFNMKLVLNRA